MGDILLLDNISFHDCKVHAFGYDKKDNQFLLDVDHISSEWILEENGYYSFKIIPSTFVFENAWNINFNMSMDNELIIDEIERFNPTIPHNIDYLPKNTIEYDWKIEFLRGEIIFKSIGFFIYQRQNEILQDQMLTIDERIGICLKKEGIIYEVR